VTWPWNEDTRITSTLAIGRDSSPDWLKRRFEQLNLDVLSREHARLVIEGEQITVTDLGSTNGTYVNGTRLQKCIATILRSGDTIRFSSSGPTITVHSRNAT
jgi:pSer/pThr/pTyr-binding forkhead associated (FHA) protein